MKALAAVYRRRSTPLGGRDVLARAALLLGFAGACLTAPAPALAAAPETPETGAASAVTATTATLHGVLNPGATGLPGSYQFSYAPSESGECAGGALAPSSPALALGAEREAVSAAVGELQPHKEYAVCLTAFSLAAEPAMGAAVPFKTAAAKPDVEAESAAVSDSTAALRASVNPENEATTFVFEYSSKGKEGGALEGAVVKLPGGETLEGFGADSQAAPEIEGLALGATYFYRVTATNAAGTTDGTVRAFTTVPAPKTEAPTAVTATTATFHGKLGPLSETAETTYHFDYAPGSEGCTSGGASSAGSAGTGKGGEVAVSTPVTGLEPSATYSVCLVSVNEFGEQVDPTTPQVTFDTPAAGPTVEEGSEHASSVTPFEATLEADINPNNQATTYSFEYATSEAMTDPTVIESENELLGYGEQTASLSTGPKLTPASTYFFRVVAENAAHEQAQGKVVEFTTPAALLPAIESEASTGVTPEGATLEAQVDPEFQETTCAFQYGTEPSLAHATTVACGEALGADASPVTGKATIAGLKLHTVYYYRALATNATGTSTGAIEQFETETTTAPAVEVESLEATDQTETSATLTAKIDPNGAATTYYIEYGTSTEYASRVPCSGCGETPAITGASPVQVFQHVTGLFANVEYHWRLVATNAAGTATTLDQTFVDDTAGPALPDNRQYEMVTPPDKNGADINGVFLRTMYPLVSEDGTRVMAMADQCFADSESCTAYRLTEGQPYEFTRTPGGWVTHPLSPPATVYGADSPWALNVNAGTALFSTPSYAGGPDEFYDRQPGGTFTPVGPFGAPQPGNGSLQANNTDISENGVHATADLGHLVYETHGPLWSFDESRESGVYEYAGTHSTVPLMVGVEGGYDNGENHDLVSVCDTELAATGAQPAGGEDLSEDGAIVYFLAVGHEDPGTCPSSYKAPPAAGLYARIDGESPSAHTVLISGPATKGCETTKCIDDATATREEGDLPPEFEGASNDGSRVFFTDAQQLTNGASESGGNAAAGCEGSAGAGCNLYESVCAEPCGTPAEAPSPRSRELIDLSEGASEAAGGPQVQGVMAVSADGSHVYFVAKGVLTAGQENQQHETAQEGEDNLYVYAEGHATFIARLSPGDEQEKQWMPSFTPIANVTPNGQFLVFTDDRALTSDDTRPEGEGAEHAAQVFEYDTQTAELRRISIGEEGFDDDGNRGTGNAYIAWPAVHGGAFAGSDPIRRDPTMSENGELVFFESPLALTPGALNDVVIGEYQGTHFAENVYEYYRGRVSLISDGKDTTGQVQVATNKEHVPTELLGVSASGADVFFSTYDQLVPEDTDDQRDYYDAHICSAASPCIAPRLPAVACQEEACHGAPVEAGVQAPPASEAFMGPGDLTPPALAPAKPKPAAVTRAQALAKALKSCRKVRGKGRRVACEKQARRRYAPAAKAKNTGRAGNERRAGR
ncbi:MAG TPA: hypothetical protein VGY13_06650 [Solirubrobacteraceae bacterium]|jgi:hypothetical protein|nr:hypothetical protein [Solirubrobacteraceae bacterium]